MKIRPRLLLVSLPFVLTVSVFGQCRDPVPPRAGFPRTFETNKTIVYSDGYKTLTNVLYPSTPPGSCGWPLLVLVHGLSGSRNTPSVEAVAMAAAGYFVVTYDVRGQADARSMNPGKGATLWGLDEWIDLKEVIDWAVRSYPGKVDKSRVACFGDSQGGIHAWAAAAYSGKRLPPNARFNGVFPVIRCVVARFFSADQLATFVPDETSFFRHLPGLAFETAHVIAQLDPAYRTQIAKYMDDDDPRGMVAFMRSVPGKDFLAELEKSTVPILAVLGWRDSWSDPNGVIRLFQRMPATTPKRLYLSVGQHGEPNNLNQGFRRLFLTESWFKRFLKGDVSPIEKGAPVLSSATPADFTTYASPISLWRHRMDRAWPPPETSSKRLFLRGGARLTEQKPDFSEGFSSIKNQVATGYNARGFHRDLGLVGAVLKQIPLSNASFETPPFTETIEIAGNPKLSLGVLPNSTKFLLAARLVAVSPQNGEQILTTGALGVREATVRVDFELGALSTVIPAGYKLRLDIRNLDIIRPLTVDDFRRIPFFNTNEVRISHNGFATSWLDVNVRRRVMPDLATAETTISVTDPLPKQFFIRSSSEWKQSFYVVLLGASGQGPPIVFPNGSILWMVTDVATDSFLQSVNGPVLNGFGGVLDADGGARCVLDFRAIAPLPLPIVGLFMQFAPTFFSWERGFEAGTPVRLRFR